MPTANSRFSILIPCLVIALAVTVSQVSASLTSDSSLSVLDAKTKAEMQAFAKNAMAAAPVNVRNGTDLDKARYLCNELSNSFANKKIKVNSENADRISHADPTDFTCGDLTERVKTVWITAGIKAGSAIDIVADKNTWKPALFDPNFNHGAPALVQDGQVYIFDLWQHAVGNGKEFSKFDISKWNSMKPSDWDAQMRKQGYVRFSCDGGESFSATVKEAVEPLTVKRPQPRQTKGGKPLLGIFDGKISAKVINEDLYLNQGTDPSGSPVAKNRNENIRKRNRIMLDNLKPNIMQPDKNTMKLQLLYGSDNDRRFQAGDTPDVSFTINGMLNGIALGSGGYISTPDPQKRVKVEVFADSFKVVKAETVQAGGGSANYTYNVSGRLQGNKVTGTWVTTYNGIDFMRGVFVADRTVKVNSKGIFETVK